MNYYEHHVGDFAKDAGYLSLLEEGAYRRLIDAYYAREHALPADERECFRLARASTKAERDAVHYVLREFFVLQHDGYHQKRCDEEIARFQSKQAKARKSAEARWSQREPDTERNANACADAMRTHCEGNALQTPDTNKTPKPPSQRAARRGEDPPVGFDRFWATYPRHEGRRAAAKAYAKIAPDETLLGVMLAALERQRATNQWQRDDGQYIPHAASWLNGRRWEDEAQAGVLGGSRGLAHDATGDLLRRAI